MATLNPEGESMSVARRLADTYRRSSPLVLPGNFVGPPSRRQVCYDTEFIDDGRTIDLISIGMVDEDGDEYYAVDRDVDQDRILRHPFLRNEVWPKLPLRRLATPRYMLLSHAQRGQDELGTGHNGLYELTVEHELDIEHESMRTREQMRNEVHNWLVPRDWNSLKHGAAIDLWAWFSSYDHVALAQLFGPMVALPPGVPMRTGDLAQEADRLNVAKESMPAQDLATKHHALYDARHDMVMKRFLADYARRVGRV